MLRRVSTVKHVSQVEIVDCVNAWGRDRNRTKHDDGCDDWRRALES